MMFEKRGRPTDRFQIQEEMTGGKNEQLKVYISVLFPIQIMAMHY